MRQRHAELRAYRHPARKVAKNLEVPDVGGDVDEMWRLLKEERKEPEELNWVPVTKEKEVSEFMIRWCIRHFGQAVGTPLSSSTRKDRLDRRLGTRILKEVANGNFTPPGLPPRSFFAS